MQLWPCQVLPYCEYYLEPKMKEVEPLLNGSNSPFHPVLFLSIVLSPSRPPLDVHFLFSVLIIYVITYLRNILMSLSSLRTYFPKKIFSKKNSRMIPIRTIFSPANFPRAFYSQISFLNSYRALP